MVVFQNKSIHKYWFGSLKHRKTKAIVQFMVWAPWAPNTINICWAPKMSWAPIASKKHVGSNGSPAHFGSPADIDGVGSPGSPGRPDRGGKPREPRRGKPRNSKRCWQHNRQLWTEAMCAKEQFFTKNFPFLILRTLREGLLDRLFPKCWHRQQKRGLTSAIIFLMDLSTMHWGPPKVIIYHKKVMISPTTLPTLSFHPGALKY